VKGNESGNRGYSTTFNNEDFMAEHVTILTAFVAGIISFLATEEKVHDGHHL
jgi:hypothetical protein